MSGSGHGWDTLMYLPQSITSRYNITYRVIQFTVQQVLSHWAHCSSIVWSFMSWNCKFHPCHCSVDSLISAVDGQHYGNMVPCNMPHRMCRVSDKMCYIFYSDYYAIRVSYAGSGPCVLIVRFMSTCREWQESIYAPMTSSWVHLLSHEIQHTVALATSNHWT